MKKNGFTLAEVLITLAIIGVVATLTLPALMNNTQEQQYKTAFKKGINTLTIAAETNAAVDGFDFSGVTDNSVVGTTDASVSPSLYAMLATRAAVNYALSGTTGIKSGGIDEMAKKGASTGDNSNFSVYFRDGSVLMFPHNALGNDSAAQAMQADNLPYGIKAVFDVNGPKLPNALSNCKGTAAQSSKDSDASQGNSTLDAVCSPDKKVIKDRFGVRLRGHYAVPNGPAARWAYEN